MKSEHEPSNQPLSNIDSPHPIDRLVGQYFDVRSESIDSQALTARILATVQLQHPTAATGTDQPLHIASQRSERWGLNSPSRFRPRSVLGMVSWLSATSAAVLLAFAIGRWETSAHASASSLVRAARSVHALAVERCYLVTIEKRSGENEKSLIPAWRDLRIWTQGDRFWVEALHNERRWAWGKNAAGAVWLTLGSHRGLQIEAGEIGKPLQQTCDLYSLEWESLLESFQNRWSLTNESTTDFTHTITARPTRLANRRITEAVIEFDRETKAVRVLKLLRNEGTAAETRIVFTLVDSRVPDESKYQPTGHLVAPYRIFSRQNLPEKRLEALKAWFGPGAENWITAIVSDSKVEIQ